MNRNNLTYTLQKYWLHYLIGVAIVLGIKSFYHTAGSDTLDWILAPTAWWVRILSKIPFERVPRVGYVNHTYRFIIAPSCSGVQFMTITIATLLFSFTHQLKMKRHGFIWIGLSVGFSYFFTIFVNGIRIVLAVYLPFYLYGPESHTHFIAPEMLHTLIGITVYFTALCLLYCCIRRYLPRVMTRLTASAESTSQKLPVKAESKNPGQYLAPGFWYLLFVLVIPLLSGSYQGNSRGFIKYSLLLTGSCLVIISILHLAAFVRKYFKKRR